MCSSAAEGPIEMESVDFEPLSALIDDDTATENLLEDAELPRELPHADDEGNESLNPEQGKHLNVAPCQNNIGNENEKGVFFVTFEDIAFDENVRVRMSRQRIHSHGFPISSTRMSSQVAQAKFIRNVCRYLAVRNMTKKYNKNALPCVRCVFLVFAWCFRPF